MENKLSRSAISSKKFFDGIDKHFALAESSEDYRNAIQTFPVGKKLYLEVSVEDSEMTDYLFRWMYGREDDGGNRTPFGCRLDVIHFGFPKNEELKAKLLEIIDSL